jgi:predicted transcriptional regulator YheO
MENEYLFSQLKIIADSIALTFGINCEVVVHDFKDMSSSIVYIAGNITKRKVGGPITDLIFKAFREHGDKVQNMYNYTTRTKDGKILKSSTIFLRNSDNKVIGCLCINIDMSHFINLKLILDNIIGFKEVYELSNIENFATSTDETIEAISMDVAKKYAKTPDNMNKAERLDFLRSLDEKGVFVLKGSVDKIAKILGISKYTVYSYLQEIKNSRNSNEI